MLSRSESPATTEPAVGLNAVAHRYKSLNALEETTLAITPGELVVIVGPSGCGKSTLLRIIGGFLAPASGAVFVGGEPVRGPGPDRGVVFQQPRLFPWLSVAGNVGFGLRMARVPAARRKARVAELLELVGLSDVDRLRPYELSGGMQQRAAIARALAPDPAILLMDEPFGALDALTRERLQEELRRVWRATGKTVLLVTHSVDEAVYLGTRVLVLSRRPGRVVFDELSKLPYEPEPRSHPDFAQLRERVSSAVRQAAEVD